MFRVDEWMSRLREQLLLTFNERLIYIGLQGSYRRNEATDSSDIDVMVVLDYLSVDDLKIYKNIISNMNDSEKACGFICGAGELKSWPKHEIFLLVHETKDYYGNLKPLVPEISRENIKDFVKISIGNLYHEICHRYIYSTIENNYKKLGNSYKSTFYILQNLYYLNNNEFISTKSELLMKLTGADKEILETAMNWNKISNIDNIEFDRYFNLLFLWCNRTLQSM